MAGQIHEITQMQQFVQTNSHGSVSLYVGDLHPKVDEPVLIEKFSPFGNIEGIHLCRNTTTFISLGYAYVRFHLQADAERALDELNFDLLKGNPMRIVWANSDATLRKTGAGNVFIKNLHKNIDNKILNDTFSAFGEILSCKVALHGNNVSKGFGFVHYKTQDQANNAIEKVNGKELMGQTVYAGPFKTRSEREQELGNRKPPFNNIYVKNFGKEIGEEELVEMFSKFGVVSSLKIATDENGNSKGFGFVGFKDFDSAKNAVNELNGKEILPNGKPLYVARALKKGERDQKLRKTTEDFLRRFRNCTIYVRFLEKDIDNDCLRRMFERFGTIKSAKVEMKNGVSCGIAFVCFMTPQEANAAVRGMNRTSWGKSWLQVTLAQRKEERQAYYNYARLRNLENPHFFMDLHTLSENQSSGVISSNIGNTSQQGLEGSGNRSNGEQLSSGSNQASRSGVDRTYRQLISVNHGSELSTSLNRQKQTLPQNDYKPDCNRGNRTKMYHKCQPQRTATVSERIAGPSSSVYHLNQNRVVKSFKTSEEPQPSTSAEESTHRSNQVQKQRSHTNRYQKREPLRPLA